MTFNDLKYDIQDVEKKLNDCKKKLEYRIYPRIGISEAIDMLVDIRNKMKVK